MTDLSIECIRISLASFNCVVSTHIDDVEGRLTALYLIFVFLIDRRRL